jgi:hypothetical protein
MTTPMPAGIIGFGFGGNGIGRSGDVKGFLPACGEVSPEADFAGA